MKTILPDFLEVHRRDHPTLPPTKRGDRFGYFLIRDLRIIASDGSDWPFGGTPWEHVSVTRPDRCPNWNDMCDVKNLFWAPEETVIQFHPAASQYVNLHRFCLHLWKPIGIEIPLPPLECLGPVKGTCG